MFKDNKGRVIRNSRFEKNHEEADTQIVYLIKHAATSATREQHTTLPAFTGNDYVACFFRKGKHLCWKHVKSSNVYVDVFARLGCQTDVSQDVCD